MKKIIIGISIIGSLVAFGAMAQKNSNSTAFSFPFSNMQKMQNNDAGLRALEMSRRASQKTQLYFPLFRTGNSGMLPYQEIKTDLSGPSLPPGHLKSMPMGPASFRSPYYTGPIQRIAPGYSATPNVSTSWLERLFGKSAPLMISPKSPSRRNPRRNAFNECISNDYDSIYYLGYCRDITGFDPTLGCEGPGVCE